VLAVAGLLWAFKAAAIMIVQDQPPLAFELGLALLPVGIIGLYVAIDTSRRFEKAGLTLAALGLSGLVLAALYSLIPGAQISSEEEFLFPYSFFFLLLGSVSGFLALAVLGIAFFRARYNLGSWRSIPLLVALLPLPLAVTGIIHFELPVLLIGVAWMALAYFLVRITSWKVKNTGQPAAG
jgi:hypothetical protein